MKVILDARDAQSVRELMLEFTRHVLGAHICQEEIWISVEVEEALIDNWRRENPGLQYPHLFKGIPVRCPRLGTVPHV